MVKVYLQYDGEPADESVPIQSDRQGREALKLKVTLPASWLDGPTSKLLTFFVDSYNKKFSDAPEKHLKVEDLYLHCCGVDLKLEAIVNTCIQDYNDVLIMHKRKQTAAIAHPEGSVLCTNYGCGKHFVPTDPEDSAPDVCAHHSKPPVFHDTFKYWACCPDKKAMDWEEFEKIPPCQKSAHSNAPRSVLGKVDQSITSNALTQEQVAAMNGEQAAPSANVESGEKRTGPREFEGAMHAQSDSKPGPVDAEGFGSCRNFGCQQRFNVNANEEGSCTYHSGGPVFWDTYKYWKCCPDKKVYEFDDFVKIPGCTKGKHKL